MQFGFKEKHSTTLCTFSMQETIQYYTNSGGPVYLLLLDASKAFDRIQFVKMFKCLMERDICPLIARLIAAIFINQQVRVKWGNHFSKPFVTSNVVKQGEVLSPVSFTLYIDKLLNRLRQSKLGCYVGDIFMGAFAYADDVAPLAPTIMSLNKLINVCVSFARKYLVLFNTIKSKLIAFNCATTENIYVTIDGEKIQRISKDVHLGNIVGECSNEIRIKVTTDDFIRRANTVMSQFKLAPYSIKYKLFKSFCSSLYGFLLWDMSAKSINKFYISWRKSLRQLYQLPYRTHNNLLHLISKNQPRSSITPTDKGNM